MVLHLADKTSASTTSAANSMLAISENVACNGCAWKWRSRSDLQCIGVRISASSWPTQSYTPKNIGTPVTSPSSQGNEHPTRSKSLLTHARHPADSLLSFLPPALHLNLSRKSEQESAQTYPLARPTVDGPGRLARLNLASPRHTVEESRGRWPMAYIIAEPCIGVKDTACVDACPVDCIHPKKNTTYDDGRPTFDSVPQLYIDPVECIDCGACVPVCPVSAIFALDDLPEKWKQFTEINASYVQGGKFTPAEFAKHQAAK